MTGAIGVRNWEKRSIIKRLDKRREVLSAMRLVKRVLIGVCVSLLILLPAVGYVMDSTDDQETALQGDASVKASDEGSQDTQQTNWRQEQATESKGPGQE